MQAFAFNIRRPKFADPRVRRAFNFALNFEEMNKQMFFGQYKRVNSYFEGTGACVERTAGGRRARDPGDGARQGAAGGFHHAVHQSGQRQPRGGARQSARGDAAAARGRLRGPRPASWSTPRPASRSRSKFLIDQPEWERLVLSYKPSLERLGIQMSRAHRRRRAIREPAAAVGLRHHRRDAGANRCRPATSSAATGARRPPTSRARAISSASRIRRWMR